jgi:glycosyltransferase involved in cell wall biosynthesis
MKLLICTQALDRKDSNLGFFYEWVAEFAKRCEKVLVICLREGEHDLPQNVEVLSLGKERGVGRFKRAILFLRYISARRGEYDAVFVHMNPEYIDLGGYLWRRWGKRVGLWYAHKSVTRRLRIAVRLADYVFTVTPDSFRIRTNKLRPLGHGIDTTLFKPDIREGSIETRLVTAGRIAASKHILEMLKVCDTLYVREEKFALTIIGEPVTDVERRYASVLDEEIKRRPYADKVQRTGAIAHAQLPALLNRQDVFLNFASTGNMDKAGLEALAMGVPVIATNPAFYALLEPYGLHVENPTAENIADAIDRIMNRPDRAAIVATLRNKIAAEHSLEKLIPTILAVFSVQS